MFKSMDECFLCSESHTPLYRVCACDTLVHAACYHRLVRVPTHVARCAVCQQPYDNDTRTFTRITCPYQPCAMLTSGLGMLFASSLGLAFLSEPPADTMLPVDTIVPTTNTTNATNATTATTFVKFAPSVGQQILHTIVHTLLVLTFAISFTHTAFTIGVMTLQTRRCFWCVKVQRVTVTQAVRLPAPAVHTL